MTLPKQMSQGSFTTDKAFEDGELRTSSKDQLMDESFGEHRGLGQQAKRCMFCSSKEMIMRQLWTLKEVIEGKNKKINELEEFIHRLSHMMLSESTEPLLSVNEQVSFKLKIGAAQTSVKGPSSINSQGFLNLSKTQLAQDKPTKKHNDSNEYSSSQMSRVNSELTAFDQENVRLEIKRSIQNMNLKKKEKEKESNRVTTNERSGRKENSLRQKLLEIIKVLPPASSNSQMHEFQSLSQPLSEGTLGTINSKAHTPKVPMSSAFSRKQQSLNHLAEKNRELIKKSLRSSREVE